MFPEEDGTYPTPYRENLFTVKASVNLTPTQFLTVRYGRNTNSQVYGVNTRSGPDNWGDSENTFNSINVNHNWVLGGSKLNEFVFQFADFANYITARTGDARQTFPNGVEIGYNVNTPQKTLQDKWQFRDDFSWHMSGMGGLGHDFKAGVNYINEPTLAVNFNTGSSDYTYVHLTNDIAGPLSSVSLNNDGGDANLPMKQFGVYFQDDWRLTSRITLNAGLRYDLVTGFAIDQSIVPNFQKLQAGGQSGLFNGVVGFQEWGRVEQGRLQQHPAAHRHRLGRVRERQGPVPGGMGHLLRLRLHQRQHPVPGHQRAGRVRREVHGDQLGRAQEPGRQLLRLRPAHQQHLVAEPGVEPQRAVLRHATSPCRGSSSRSRSSSRSAGRTSSRRRRSSTPTTSTSRARTSACGGSSTRSRRPARAATRRSASARRTRR